MPRCLRAVAGPRRTSAPPDTPRAFPASTAFPEHAPPTPLRSRTHIPVGVSESQAGTPLAGIAVCRPRSPHSRAGSSLESRGPATLRPPRARSTPSPTAQGRFLGDPPPPTEGPALETLA